MLSDTPKMAARLTTENLRQGFSLLSGCTFVGVKRRLHFDLRHVAGTMDGKRHVKAVERDLTEATFINVPREKHGAIALGRELQEDTRAGGFAVAGFEVRAF